MTETLIKECRKTIEQYREEILKSKDAYLLNMRIKALDRLNKNVQELAKDGFGSKIVLGIARKKADVISRIVCDSEIELLALDSCPRYDGEKYVAGVPKEYFIPEEEIVYWIALSTLRILSKEENARLLEVSAMVYREETREIVGNRKESI